MHVVQRSFDYHRSLIPKNGRPSDSRTSEPAEVFVSMRIVLLAKE